MASTRLPAKIMLPLGGRPVLLHVYERCKRAKTVDEVIILTSKDKENDKIQSLCEENNIKCFRGSENDVLDRYFECSQIYKPDIIVRVTSDCPLIEPKLIDYYVTNMIRDDIDFIEEESHLYEGFGLDIFTIEALNTMKKKAKLTKQKEHVIGYYYDNKSEFKHKLYPLPDKLRYVYSEHRLTLDTPLDYDLIRIIYSNYYTGEHIVKLEEVMKYLDNNREISSVNKEVVQKDYYKE